jgi:hypothetical protein
VIGQLLGKARAVEVHDRIGNVIERPGLRSIFIHTDAIEVVITTISRLADRHSRVTHMVGLSSIDAMATRKYRTFGTPLPVANRIESWRNDAVKLPSFTIAEMMVIIAIVAVDLLVIRAANSGPAIPLFLVGGSPVQIALVIGLLLVLRRRRRAEKPTSFLAGFLLAGWIGHLIYAVLCIRAAGPIDMELGNILNPTLNATGFRLFSVLDLLPRLTLGSLCLSGPQFAFAFIGGWIGDRWSNTISRASVTNHE